MNAQFRSQYAARGRTLRGMGYEVEQVADDGVNILGFHLLDLAADRDPEARLAQEAPLGSPPGKHVAGSDPPKNDGLVEG
jgi:hypothetical protein